MMLLDTFLFHRRITSIPGIRTWTGEGLGRVTTSTANSFLHVKQELGHGGAVHVSHKTA